MLILKERLEHVPIMSLHTGAQIAETGEFIIDPRQLKVIGFYCKGPRLDLNPAILSVEDIREFSNIGLIVDSADVLMSPDDLVRLKEVLEYHFVLDGKQVVDTAGNKLGQVANYTLDSTTLYVVKLHVRPSLWHAWTHAELIIDRTQVVEVNDHQLIVRDPRDKEDEKAKAPLLENPFRHAPVESSTTEGAHK
jgi:sporulation protein YlmC with PRC-barrel domain